MSDQAVLFQNDVLLGPRGIILVKGQLGHFYTFCTMPILIFCPVANFGDQSLILIETDLLPKYIQSLMMAI